MGIDERMTKLKRDNAALRELTEQLRLTPPLSEREHGEAFRRAVAKQHDASEAARVQIAFNTQGVTTSRHPCGPKDPIES